MAEKKKTTNQLNTVRRVLRYLRSYLWLVALSILLAAAITAGTLSLPILQGDAIDLIIGPNEVNLQGILEILLKMGIVIGLTALAQWVQNVCNNRITFRVVRDLRSAALKKIEVLPLSYLDTHPAGDIVSRVISDSDQLAEGLLLGFTQLFSGVLAIFGTLFFMFRIDWRIALLVVVLTPISLFVAKFIASRTYGYFKQQSVTKGTQTALIDEMIGGRNVVQAYGRQKQVQERFDKVNEELRQASLKAVFFSSLTNPCTRCVNSLVYAAAAVSGAVLAIPGAITIGQLTAVLSYANQYTKPFNEISGVVTELQNAIACAERLLELIELEPETPDPENPAVLESFRGEISLDNISFSYLKDRKLIENLSLQVKPGMKVAIVGPTGCGKTTLINLLMRFYDVDAGSISVDGVPVRSMTRENLRKGYGMVLQDTWLREGTIRENIAMGRPDATEEEIIAAAKAAHCHSFIRHLPERYDTVLHGDGGLSAGQKQLLCIARVMLANPSMLILDEATSSIDTRTELKIQQSFDELSRGRTSFIVAHRLSTIRTADLILVMKDGTVIETGTHTELLRKGGFYANLYNSQFAQS